MTTAIAMQKKLLREYAPPSFYISEVFLTFEIDPKTTQVTSVLKIQVNPQNKQSEIVLDGESLTLISVSLNGIILTPEDFKLTEKSLSIKVSKKEFELKIITHISPSENTQLEGLYLSKGMYSTQCEAEGFRRITYYLDRPDVLAKFTTKIIAPSGLPILLSNGNLIDQGNDEENSQHWAVWQDPFPKPCYLFALVAGKLECITDHFITSSGKKIDLKIYAEAYDADKLDYAMNALKQSMAWDERRFGREYDLDLFMIVAVSHFNMGAMENKGLNIFNSSCLVSHPKLTTDKEYRRISSIVAHEYLHNWSGNRITCRDWFQLSLKEGFTVYRDQVFSADLFSPAVERIESVQNLIEFQFTEDAGPLSHPVRPHEYEEINNFYTMTIYEKGAEIVRILQNLVGEKKFRQGTDYYFETYDGQAATIEDFVSCIHQVAPETFDKTQFLKWYDQGGTPIVQCSYFYDAVKKQLSLDFNQAAPEHDLWKNNFIPKVIPIRLALVANDGTIISLKDLKTNQKVYSDDQGDLIVLNQSNFSLTIEGLENSVIPSIGRGFSAPVHWRVKHSLEGWRNILKYETDSYCRWAAARHLYKELILGTQNINLGLCEFGEILLQILNDKTLDKRFQAALVRLPSFQEVIQGLPEVQVLQVLDRLDEVKEKFSQKYRQELVGLYQSLQKQASSLSNDFSGEAMGCRDLKNLILTLLTAQCDEQVIQFAEHQLMHSKTMTEIYEALKVLIHNDAPKSKEYLDYFRQIDPLHQSIIQKW
ncbi:MAG: aminopeptidase N, partial [Pseudomonadota bacterium]